MRILVACEESQEVTKELRKLGHAEQDASAPGTPEKGGGVLVRGAGVQAEGKMIR